jgi:hypothetical protein
MAGHRPSHYARVPGHMQCVLQRISIYCAAAGDPRGLRWNSKLVDFRDFDAIPIYTGAPHTCCEFRAKHQVDPVQVA